MGRKQPLLTSVHGRVVHVDLSTRVIRDMEVPDVLLRSLLGGRGLNQYLLACLSNCKDAPDSADAPVLVSCGLLVGTAAPGAVRISLDAKNLFSRGIGSANAGGDFAAYMKASGIGTLVLTGASETPCYLELCDAQVHIREAAHLWGRTVTETVDVLEASYPCPVKVMCIGPAAERGVRSGCVIVDRSRAAAKCGIGSILGFKRVKAIVSAGGDFSPQLAHPTRFARVSAELWERIAGSPTAKTMNAHGTLCGVNTKNPFGAAPFRHYQDGYMDPDRMLRINETAFKQYEVHRFGPRGCPIRCRATYRVPSGHYAGTSVDAVQANTVQNFGIKLDVDEPAAILHAQMLCNDYGMDIDTMGETIAWAFECFQEGILGPSDVEQLELRWGNHRVLRPLIARIGMRKSFGDLLAEGTERAAREIGARAQQLVVAMKGQDLYEAVQNPRGYGLGAALATRGGGHCSGSPFCEFYPGAVDEETGMKVYGVPTAGNPSTYHGKAKLVAYHECLHSIINSLGVCGFVTVWQRHDLLDIEDLTTLVRAATGWDLDSHELMHIGERIHTLERWFNHVHAGMDRSADYPPDRFFRELVQRGPYAGLGLDRARFDAMLSENYAIHRWSNAGVPTEAALQELGITELLDG